MCDFRFIIYTTGAGPGFLVGGGAKPRGVPTSKIVRFSQNRMKLRKFWSVGGTPLDPPLYKLHLFAKRTL